MFDINTFLSAALSAAIIEATKPLLERIATLESANDILHRTQHEDMVAMRDRITALEAAAPQPVGVDPKTLAEASLNYLNDQEWFWDKMRNFIDAAIEEAIDNHCETYDHDSYDNAVSDLEDRDFVTNDSLEDAVREAVGNLSFDISVS